MNFFPLFQVQFETLSLLYQVPQSDVIASESWAGIRKGLLAALADEDEQLAVSNMLINFCGQKCRLSTTLTSGCPFG